MVTEEINRCLMLVNIGGVDSLDNCHYQILSNFM